MPIDVGSLIDHRAELKLETPSLKDRGMNPELKLFLGEKAKWDVFSCLLGYAETEMREIPEVLDEIPSNIEGSADDWTLPFLSYSAEYKHSSDSSFVAALKTVKSIAAGSVLLNTSIVKIQRCLRDHPDDNEAFLKCLHG
jgi:hypothetical protein